MKAKGAFRRISAKDLRKKLDEGRDVILIDTLTSEHFQKAHLPGARNACVFEVVFLENVGNITRDEKSDIVVYGSSEKSMDAETAAEKLLRAGYKNVTALEGGLKKWRTLGFELEGDQPELAEEEIPPALLDRTYVLDIEQSAIGWTGRNPNTTHHGTVRLSGGEIFIKNGLITGNMTVDMTTIRNINLEGDPLQPVLIRHLMSDDFFFTEMFPEAVFTITAARPIEGATQSEPNFEVEGALELMGIKKEMSFVANASREPGGEVKIESHFDVDRTQWGIIYGSARFFEKLGMHLVFDHISAQLHLVAR
jgi:polyisoprenoid-binding protein YceI/rhodanese-related sulfurtransferase